MALRMSEEVLPKPPRPSSSLGLTGSHLASFFPSTRRVPGHGCGRARRPGSRRNFGGSPFLPRLGAAVRPMELGLTARPPGAAPLTLETLGGLRRKHQLPIQPAASPPRLGSSPAPRSLRSPRPPLVWTHSSGPAASFTN